MGPVNSSGSIKYWISVCIIRGAGSGALRQLLLRENDRSYCMSKVIAAMLAGGITLLIANIVYGIICYAAFPSLSCYPAEDVSEYIASQFSEGIPVFVINYIIKTFLYGVL